MQCHKILHFERNLSKQQLPSSSAASTSGSSSGRTPTKYAATATATERRGRKARVARRSPVKKSASALGGSPGGGGGGGAEKMVLDQILNQVSKISRIYLSILQLDVLYNIYTKSMWHDVMSGNGILDYSIGGSSFLLAISGIILFWIKNYVPESNDKIIAITIQKQQGECGLAFSPCLASLTATGWVEWEVAEKLVRQKGSTIYCTLSKIKCPYISKEQWY